MCLFRRLAPIAGICSHKPSSRERYGQRNQAYDDIIKHSAEFGSHYTVTSVSHLIAFNKPFNVLCQFADREGRSTLSNYIDVPGIYAAGRLDRDSEGLLLLTDCGALQQRIAHPSRKLWKRYWVQVEGTISDAALQRLRNGIALRDGPTAPANAKRIEEPERLWPRDPPVRFRKSVSDSWLELEIHEGRNRQVRRMTAAVGYPTLRLIRCAIGPVSLEGLRPGTWRDIDPLLFGPIKQKTIAAPGQRARSRSRN